MIRYWLTKDESLCCGCRVCELSCPTNAISMQSNIEGFYYPVVRQEVCVECDLCSRVCPVEHRPSGKIPLAAYAVQHSNEKILRESSSGGVFRMMADAVIREGGCVIGCTWEKNNRPVLKIADQENQLCLMQGSKYLSSDTDMIFDHVKQRLEKGQLVLFTGAPCQCAALLNFLKKTYDNLITADFLCHGMPSQQIFDAYIADLEKKYGAKIYDIHFRDKEKRGWGMTFSFKFLKKDREKKIYRIGWTDPYQYGFIQGYFNRYSCYSCVFRGKYRFTDFTFCDYWGIEQYHPEIQQGKGVSAVSINTEKAEKFKENLLCDGIWTATGLEQIAKGNESLLSEIHESIPEFRGSVYERVRDGGWNSIEKKYLRTRHLLLKRIWYRIPKDIAKKIRKLIK